MLQFDKLQAGFYHREKKGYQITIVNPYQVNNQDRNAWRLSVRKDEEAIFQDWFRLHRDAVRYADGLMKELISK